MKAKSYLDKRTELLPGTRASLFVTDGWRGREEEGGGGGGGRRRRRGGLRGKWLVFACSYAIREIECCVRVCRRADHVPRVSVTIQTDSYGFCFLSVHL